MRRLSTLPANQQGAIAMLFGLMMVPLIGFLGLAIDTARVYAVNHQLQQSIDAAALAGGRNFFSPDRNVIMQRYFDQNWSSNRYGATASALAISANMNNGNLNVNASATVPLILMPILGWNQKTVGASVQIIRADKSLELAMVLDDTGSMDGSCTGCVGNKMNTLKISANTLLDILFNGKAVDNDLYISVVPFNEVVRIGSSYSGWLKPTGALDWNGGSGGLGTWSGCTFNRAYPRDINDDPPSVEAFYPFYMDRLAPFVAPAYPLVPITSVDPPSFWVQPGYTAVYPNDDICRNYPPVLPLNSKRSDVQNAIGAMTPQGTTMTTVGSAWGWRTISPRWRGLWAGTSSSVPFDYTEPDNIKAMILMTDGENNFRFPWTAYYTRRHNFLANPLASPTPATTASGPDVDELNDRQLELCNMMKAENIRIYTILLGVSGPSPQRTLLTACATSPSMFFDAGTGSTTLQAAFKAIATDLASLRISQ